MITAYLDDNQVILNKTKGETLQFPVGNAVTGMLPVSPYSFFPKGKSKAAVFLNKLYAMQDLPFEEQTALFSGITFSVSMETISGVTVPVFSLKTAEELIALEILTLLRSGKPLKKCEHCGEYFFPQGRSDAVYCDRVGADGFSCKKIGAHRQYRKNSRLNEVKAMYDKQTKHNRYLKNTGKISQWDYDRWMASVSKSYTAYKNGDISERTLMTRLYETLSPAGRSAKRDISYYLL